MLTRDEWLDLARNVDRKLSYVTEEQALPAVIAGLPWLPATAWATWEEPYRITFRDYVVTQRDKEPSLYAVRDAGGRGGLPALDPGWVNSLELRLRAARFGRSADWRTTTAFGALDELRHTQIPLLLMHELVRQDGQVDWTHRFYHSNNWVAIAGGRVMLARALDLAELWQGEMKSVVVQGKEVLLVNVDGEVHAYQDRCRHLAVQLSKGTFAEGVITCWAHDWQYDARTGRGVNPSNVSLRRYPVAVRDGAIWVDVDG